jgi:hypothetical protein
LSVISPEIYGKSRAIRPSPIQNCDFHLYPKKLKTFKLSSKSEKSKESQKAQKSSKSSGNLDNFTKALKSSKNLIILNHKSSKFEKN